MTLFKTNRSSIYPLAEPLDIHVHGLSWGKVKSHAKIFNPDELKEIYALLTVPNTKETLVCYADGHLAISPFKAEDTLCRFTERHHLVDPLLIRRALKKVLPFCHYKTPLVNSKFVLVPLESASHGIWINPARIQRLAEKRNRRLIELTSGLTFYSPLQQQALENAALNGLAVLALFKRDFIPDWTSLCHSPLEYLNLDQTPFVTKICIRQKATTWCSPPGELFDRFQHEVKLQHIHQYCEDMGFEY